MGRLGVVVDQPAIAAMISAYLAMSLVTQATTYYSAFIVMKVDPIRAMYGPLLALSGKLGNVDEMDRLYQLFRQPNLVSPASITDSITLAKDLLTGYCYAGEYTIAGQLWDGLRLANVEKRKTVAFKLDQEIDFAGSDEANKGLLARFGVDPEIFCVYMDMLGFSGNSKAADAVWEDLNSAGFPFTLSMVKSYCQAMVRFRQSTKAIDVLLGIKESYGLDPDEKLVALCLSQLPSSDRPTALGRIVGQYPDLSNFDLYSVPYVVAQHQTDEQLPKAARTNARRMAFVQLQDRRAEIKLRSEVRKRTESK